MIARVLYRNNVQGVLNYVSGKSKSTVLGFQNTYSDTMKAIVKEMAKSERFLFLKKYLYTDSRTLDNRIQEQFNIVRDKLYVSESVREKKELNTKAELIKQAIGRQLFEAPKQNSVLFELLQSLDSEYDRGKLTYANSHQHRVDLDIGPVPYPEQIEFYASPSFIRENEKVLDGLLNDRTGKEILLTPTAIFLPLMFPNLYAAMTPAYRQRFERLSLKSYHKHAERMQVSFEKSPKDYIQFFNEKGFYFDKREGRLFIGSIYSKYPVKVPITPKTQAYLESSSDVNKTLNNQAEILNDIGTSGRDNLKSLWSGHLVERGQYTKAAYLFVLDGSRPNLLLQQLEHHMQKGLKEALSTVSQIQVDKKQARLLRKGIYAIGNLLGDNSFKEEEMFNGFKDEFTDWSKYRSGGISM